MRIPKPNLSRSVLAVLAARLVLLFAALTLALAGAAVALGNEPNAAASEHYACPMHAEVTANQPGQCPICKMALEPLGESRGRAASAGPSEHPADCPMHPKPDPAGASKYVCPMHPEVRADAPGTCSVCKMKLVPAPPEKPKAAEKTIPATLGPTPTPPVSSSFAAGVTWLPETHPPSVPARRSNEPLFDTPKRRTFTEAVRAPAWYDASGHVSAVVYRDELLGLSPGEQGRFVRGRAPGAPLDARLTDERPTNWDASTSLVRFALESRAGGNVTGEHVAGARSAPAPGDAGWLELEARPRELLVVPESALLRSASGPYVLVASAGGRDLVRRPLQIGRIIRGHVVVLSGIEENERVVVAGAFFHDAEARDEAGSAPIAGVER